MTDYPVGNGDLNCTICKGRGVVPVEIDGWPGGATQNCRCVFARDLHANVKRVWPVLLEVESVEETPLMDLTNRDLWITASNFDLRRHLRFVAYRMGPRWYAKVISDASLMTAWLSTAKEVFDTDVLLERGDPDRPRLNPSDEYQTIVDLVAPLDLLIIQLGVKAAKNREMPGVLVEALEERRHIGKPSWIVDSPAKPLMEGHMSYDGRVAEVVDSFDRIRLTFGDDLDWGGYIETTETETETEEEGHQPAPVPAGEQDEDTEDADEEDEGEDNGEIDFGDVTIEDGEARKKAEKQAKRRAKRGRKK